MKIGKIKIYDNIGKGFITGKDILNLVEDFESAGCEKFQVRINSDGGDIFEGFDIYNTFKFRNVDIYISGIAASISSYIACSGKKTYIYKNSHFHVHNPWTISIGDYQDKIKTAKDLENFRDKLVEVYAEKTGLPSEELKMLMDEETILSAEKARDYGFVDEIIDTKEPSDYVALYSEIYDDNPNQLNSEEKMLNKTLALLGFTPEEIETGVSDEAYNAKLTELGIAQDATLSDVFAELKKPAPPKPTETPNAEIKALQDRIDTLETTIKDSNKTKAELEAKEKAETLVNAAVADFKILASQTDTYVAAAIVDPDKVKAELEAIPKDTVKSKLKVGETFDKTDAVAIANASKKYVADKAKEGITVSMAEAARIVTN